MKSTSTAAARVQNKIKTLARIGITVLACTACFCGRFGSEPSRVKMVNNGTGNADIRIISEAGTVEYLNNVKTGSSTEWKKVGAGSVSLVLAIKGAADTNQVLFAEYRFSAAPSRNYVVNIGAGNSITARSITK